MNVDRRSVVHKGNKYASASRNSMSEDELEMLYSMVVKKFDDLDQGYISRKDVIEIASKFFTPVVLRRYERTGELRKTQIGKGEVIYFLDDIKNVLHDIIVGKNKKLIAAGESHVTLEEEPSNV
jgi:hypothetical protein